MKNACKLSLNLNNIDFVVFSHGHIDHTWGLFHLIKFYTERAIENIKHSKPEIIAHPLTFYDKQTCDKEEIGSIITEKKLSKHFNVNLSKELIWITEKLVFLGEIERRNNSENKIPIGKVQYDDNLIDDCKNVF